MIRHIRGHRIPLLVSAILLFACFLTAFLYTFIGVMDEVGTNGAPLAISDLSSVPQAVVDDATVLAKELFGGYRGKYEVFVNELLALYVEAKGTDVVVLFNSGGWGKTRSEDAAGWASIFEGIHDELQVLGYNTLFVNYQRTENNLRGAIDEFVELLSIYPTKSNTLARRVEFLTNHIPELNVIVAGESNGTVISDSVMTTLRDNPRVYSIQTGPPFWYRQTMRERTLVLDNNGLMPDAFSTGDAGAILLASTKALLGLAPRDDAPGRILSFLRAPGHDYQWQYPNVYYQITTFLSKNFSLKPS